MRSGPRWSQNYRDPPPEGLHRSNRQSSPRLERAKRRARGRVYGRQYLTLADKYFWLGMNADARRCYWAALLNDPSHAFNPGLERRLAATIIGRERYERGTTLFSGAAARN